MPPTVLTSARLANARACARRARSNAPTSRRKRAARPVTGRAEPLAPSSARPVRAWVYASPGTDDATATFRRPATTMGSGRALLRVLVFASMGAAAATARREACSVRALSRRRATPMATGRTTEPPVPSFAPQALAPACANRGTETAVPTTRREHATRWAAFKITPPVRCSVSGKGSAASASRPRGNAAAIFPNSAPQRAPGAAPRLAPTRRASRVPAKVSARRRRRDATAMCLNVATLAAIGQAAPLVPWSALAAAFAPIARPER